LFLDEVVFQESVKIPATVYIDGDNIEVHAFRRDQLMRFDLTLDADGAPQFTLEPREKPVAGARLRKVWLKAKK